MLSVTIIEADILYHVTPFERRLGRTICECYILFKACKYEYRVQFPCRINHKDQQYIECIENFLNDVLNIGYVKNQKVNKFSLGVWARVFR